MKFSQQIKYDDNPDLAEKLRMFRGQIKKYEVFITLLYDGFICDSLFFPDTTQLRHIIDQLFAGLGELIRANKCHNDLKPTNILYRCQNNIYSIKIGDFAQCGTNGGTPGWTAPVFIKRRQPGKEDMYSIGLIILRLLCLNQQLFHCLRDNFVKDADINQHWMINFKNMTEIKFITKMIDLDNQLTYCEVINEWEQIKSSVRLIDAPRLLQLSVPRQYMQTQYQHTE